MASLESLANSFERTAVLPQAMNFNTDPTTGSGVWDVARQYFLNDVAISGVDGGAYIYSGATTTRRGGTDPSTDPANWTKTFPNGVSYFETVAPTTADAGGGTITVTGGVVTVPSGSDWLCILQGQAVNGAPLTADITETWTLTGAGGDAQSFTISPNVGAGANTTTNFGVSGVVSVGGAGTTITLTGSYQGNFQPTTLKLTCIRLF